MCPIEQELYSVPEAAMLLGMKVDSLWRWVYNREIPSVKIGHFRKIRRKDIDRFLDERTIPVRRVN
jgi:excisionase family DNA binding protein